MKLSYEELEQKVKSLENRIEELEDINNSTLENKNFLSTLLDTIPNPVFYKNIDGVYKTLNDSFSKTILGIAKEEIIGRSLFELPEVIPYELAKIYHEKDLDLFHTPGTQSYEAQVKCADEVLRDFYFYKASVYDNKNKVIGIVGVMLDITELKSNQLLLDEKNKQLTKLSYIDSLTGAFNRRKFDELFKYRLENRRGEDEILNYLMLDIDHFKSYNDNYGHFEGDMVLKIITQTIKSLLKRENDYLFRIGGEEFGLIFDSESTYFAEEFCERIRKQIENLNIEHKFNHKHEKVTVSIGLVSVESKLKDSDIVYKEADIELYKSKKSGRNTISSKIL